MSLNKNIFTAGLLCFVWTLFSLNAQVALETNPGIPTASEKELFTLVNQARLADNLPPLLLDERLTAAARAHSQLLSEFKNLAHQYEGEPPLQARLAQAGVPFDSAGENVANSSSVPDAHTEFMHSPGHRANILGKQFNAVGIGIMQRGEHLYVTEDFAHRVPHYSAAQVEGAVLETLNEIRAHHGLAKLKRVDASNLAHIACEPGTNAKNTIGSLPAAEWLVVFTGADPTAIPEPLRKVVMQSDARSVALGACFPPADKDSYAMFRVVTAFYR